TKYAANESRRRSLRSSTRPDAFTEHTEKTFFARSTPMVIVLTETSPSADGCVETPSWHAGSSGSLMPKEVGSLFLLSQPGPLLASHHAACNGRLLQPLAKNGHANRSNCCSFTSCVWLRWLPTTQWSTLRWRRWLFREETVCRSFLGQIRWPFRAVVWSTPIISGASRIRALPRFIHNFRVFSRKRLGHGGRQSVLEVRAGKGVLRRSADRP